MKRLCDSGEVVKLERGLYALPECALAVEPVEPESLRVHTSIMMPIVRPSINTDDIDNDVDDYQGPAAYSYTESATADEPDLETMDYDSGDACQAYSPLQMEAF